MVCPDSSLRCMAKRSPVWRFSLCPWSVQAPLFLPDAYGANRQAGVLIKSLFSNFPLPNVDAETQARAPEGKSDRNKTEVQLSDTLKHLQTRIKALLRRIDDLIPVRYLVLDGYFGHNPALQMTQQCGLALISKLRIIPRFIFHQRCLTPDVDARACMDSVSIHSR